MNLVYFFKHVRCKKKTNAIKLLLSTWTFDTNINYFYCYNLVKWQLKNKQNKILDQNKNSKNFKTGHIFFHVFHCGPLIFNFVFIL